MKRFLISLAVLGSIALAPLSLAAQTTLETGLAGYFTDIGGVYADGTTYTNTSGNSTALFNKAAAGGTQTDKYSPSLTPYFNLQSGVALAEGATIKLGLYGEDYLGLYTGTINPFEFQTAGYFSPSAELLVSGLDVKVGLPIVFFSQPGSANNSSAINELKYAYKQYSFGPIATSYFNNDTWFTTYDKATYKIAFDQSSFLTIGFEDDVLLAPIAWFQDIKPQFSLGLGSLQLDNKFDLFFQYSNNATYFYLGPKATFDFGAIGAPGLKLFTSARIATSTNDLLSNSALTSSGGKYSSSADWHDTQIIPGVSFKVGGLYLEGDVKFAKIDANPAIELSDNGVIPYVEPALKVAYTFNLK